MSAFVRHWKVGLLLAAAVAVVVAVVLWPRQGQGTNTAGGEWTCSMHPQVRQPRPGRCPICGMDLIPVEKLSEEKAHVEQRAGVEV